MMSMAAKTVELSRATFETLEACLVGEGDAVVIYTDTSKDPQLVDAFLVAAHALAGDVSLLQRRPAPTLAEPPARVREYLASATMVVDMQSNPWLYTDALNSIISGGTRVLQVNASASSVGRLTPSTWKVERARLAAELFTAADDLEIRSPQGSRLLMRAHGRSGWGQDGIVMRPGDWDGAATSIFAVAPLEDSASGELVLEPGDCVRPLGFRVRERVTLRFENGRAVSAHGEADAQTIWSWLLAWGDQRAFGVSHTGFGGDPRSDMADHSQWESRAGGINLALGSNHFRFLGGTNKAPSHMDLVLLGHTMLVNGEVVVREGQIVEPGIASGGPRVAR
jgi:leucyl aminopeptidase (aminopeptidase T)